MITDLVQMDVALFKIFNGWHNPFYDWIAYIVTQFGSGWVLAPVLLAIYWVKIPREKLMNVVLVTVIALSLSGIVNSIFKKAVDRDRPPLYFSMLKNTNSSQNDSFRVHIVGRVLRHGSFPSGHTNTAFSAATVLVFLFGSRWLFTFIIAFLVGYSRIYMGIHFPLDTVAGAFIAVVISSFIMWYTRKYYPHVPFRTDSTFRCSCE